MEAISASSLQRQARVYFSRCLDGALTYFNSPEVDEGALAAVIIGVALGLVVLVGLSIFPGKALSIDNRSMDVSDERNKSPHDSEKKSRRDPSSLATARPRVSNETRDERKLTRPQIERLKQRLGLSDEEMRRAVASAEREARGGGGGDFSFFRGLDAAVFVALVASLVYFVNRDYGNAVTVWLVRTFPREAETLGFRI